MTKGARKSSFSDIGEVRNLALRVCFIIEC